MLMSVASITEAVNSVVTIQSLRTTVPVALATYWQQINTPVWT